MPEIEIAAGSNGIGLAVAKLLAAEGDTRVTLLVRDEAKLGKAVPHDFIAAELPQPEGIDLVAWRLAARDGN